MKKKVLKSSFLIAATFVLGLIVNFNVSSNKIELTTQQVRAEASSCYMVIRYCYNNDLGWKCLDNAGSTRCNDNVCAYGYGCYS